MHFFRNFFIGLVLLLLVLLGLPWLLPTEAYVPKLEALAESQLNQKVKIGSIQLALLPSPRLHLKDLVIGNSLLKVKVLTVVPDVFSLLADEKVIRAVKIDSLSVKSDALAMVSNLKSAKNAESSAGHIVLREIEIDEFEYITADLKLPKLSVLLTLANNLPVKANIKSLDGRLSLLLLPSAALAENGVYELSAEAHDWTLPVAYPFKLDTLYMQASVHGEALQIKRLEATAYQGKINAHAMLSFAKRFELNGQLKIENLSLEPALSVVSNQNKLSGRLLLNGPFKARAESLGQLVDKLSATFKFEVKDGMIKGVDLLKIASLLLTKSNSDGNTQFDSFTGQLLVSGKQYEVKNLDLSSGLIQASGGLKIKPSRALDGVVKVEVKNSATMVAVPLAISGTVTEPSVLPTKSAMAGAVIGTAILGPGAGTTVGIKVGEKLESIKKGLFGGK